MLNCQSDEWSTYPTWQHVSQEFPCRAAKIRRWIQLFHKGKLLSVVWGEWADLSVFRYSFSMWWVLSHHLSVNVYHHCSVDGFDHSYEITRILSMLLHLLCWNEQLLSIISLYMSFLLQSHAKNRGDSVRIDSQYPTQPSILNCHIAMFLL